MDNILSSISPLSRAAAWRDFSRRRSISTRDRRMPQKVNSIEFSHTSSLKSDAVEQFHLSFNELCQFPQHRSFVTGI